MLFILAMLAAIPVDCPALPGADASGETDYRAAACLIAKPAAESDYPTIRRLLEDAVAKAYVPASCSLGQVMVMGWGGSVDAVKGVEICRTAARTGDLQSELEYGNFALRGIGMPRDPALAMQMLSDAARRGSAIAALAVGDIYWNGDGVPKDNAAAATWWRQAYAGGRKEAAILLGNETFVRLTAVPSPDKADPAVLADAIAWYDRAKNEDSDPSARDQAIRRLDLLHKMESFVGKPLPAH